MADGYAGDVAPKEAWEWLKNDPDTVLVDCRTQAEWNYVGLPDLESIGKETVTIEWVNFPENEKNPHFTDRVKASEVGPEQRVLFLCRSGVRSIAAAQAMTEEGYTSCFSILEGFEGDKNGDSHRASVGGWKYNGLPWKQ